MMISTRLFYNFALYFSKSLQTTPLLKAKEHLISFVQARPSKQQFEPSFSAYQHFLLRVIEDNHEESKFKVDIFDLATQIYSHYKFPSKKLQRLHNRLADDCLKLVQKEPPSKLISVLIMLTRYNKGKALALFKAHKEQIKLKMKQFQSYEIIKLLSFLREAQIDDPLMRQTSIQLLYSQLNHLNANAINLLLTALSHSKKYINKDFVARLGQRILQLYRCNNIQERQIYGALASLSEIEANLHTRAVYVQQLDQLYELTLPAFFTTAEHLPDHLLNRIISALRRSKYYQQACLTKLANIALTRQIRQLADDSTQARSKKLDISLRTFLNIVHTHAVFNYHHVEFKKYVMQIIKIMMIKEDSLIQLPSFTKLLWSLCVLYDRIELVGIYPLIDKYMENAGQVHIAEAMNMYYCYLYLRATCPQINQHRDKIHNLLSRSSIQTHTSNTQMQVYHAILEAGVPCIPQYNLNNIPCDIMIPEWKHLRNVIIELHGFKHFCRNVKRLTGSNALKEKIISNEMYRYYYITVDEWLVVEDKQSFIKELLEHINQVEQKRSLEKKEEKRPQTATRIRGRPRAFRIATETKPLLE